MYAVPRRKPVSMAVSPMSESPRESMYSMNEWAQGPTVGGVASDANSAGYAGSKGVNAEVQQRHDMTGYSHISSVDGSGVNPPLGRRKPQSCDPFTILSDCAVLLVSGGMIAFIVLIWRLDGHPYVEGSLDTWRNATNILATVFPILFAATASRLLIAAAHWRLERGASMGTLETLMGSRTVGSTIITLVKLRTVSFAAAGLMLLWSVSPIGAQALLRLLSVQSRITQSSVNLTYFDVEYTPSALGTPTNVNSFNDEYMIQRHTWDTLYLAHFLTRERERTSPMDLWGNVKIPLLQRSGTKTVNETDTHYSSLLGIPLNFTLPLGNASFLLESSYIDLQCSDFDQAETGSAERIRPLKNVTEGLMGEDLNKNMTKTNGTWWGGPLITHHTPWAIAMDTFYDQSWLDRLHPYSGNLYSHTLDIFPRNNTADAGSPQLLFQAHAQFSDKGTISPGAQGPATSWRSICNVQQTYVESRVNCTGPSPPASLEPTCMVVSQRPSRKPHPSSSLTLLSFPDFFYAIAAELPRQLGKNFRIPDQSLQYIYYGEVLQDPYNITLPAAIPGEEFSTRLSQVLNTFILATQLRLAATPGVVLRSDRRGNDSLMALSTRWSDSGAELTTSAEFIVVSKPWALIYFLSSVVLFLSGLVGVVLIHCLRGPEVLGFVSSSVRDSRFVDVPPGTREMDGLALTRHIRAWRVKLGAVQTGEIQGERFLQGSGDEPAVVRTR